MENVFSVHPTGKFPGKVELLKILVGKSQLVSSDPVIFTTSRPTAIKLSLPFGTQNGSRYYDVTVFVLLACNCLHGASNDQSTVGNLI